MAMHWDVSDIKDSETVTTDPNDPKKWHPLTMALVNVTMSVDLGTITAKNLDEWFWRLAYCEAIGKGKFLIEWDAENPKPRERNFTREEVESHIGLRTNVSTETRAAFIKRWNRGLAREADSIAARKFAKPVAA